MIIAIGDVHGKFNQLISKMEYILESNVGVNFVQLGDFGLGFDRPYDDWKQLDYINTLLKDKESNMYIIRGNHDNPAFWYDGLRFHFSNIKFVKDDELILIEDKFCYFGGGAISVDRKRRTQGVDYWQDEPYTYLGWILDDGVDRIDLLFTHDVYHNCSPYTVSNSNTVNYFASVDEHLIEHLLDSQNEMKLLYNDIVKINPTFTWYHGHYHESHMTNNDGQKIGRAHV